MNEKGNSSGASAYLSLVPSGIVANTKLMQIALRRSIMPVKYDKSQL